MKKYLFLSVVFALFTFSLSAQSPGRWTGEVQKNGKTVKFNLDLKATGSFLMAYDLNPNDLTVKGRWSSKGDVLSFKTSKGSVQFKKIASKRASKGFLLTFKTDKGYSLYNVHGLPKESLRKEASAVFGWDEGVAAVVVNHEEQY